MDRLKFQNCIEDLTRTQKKVLDEILKGNACGEIAKTRKVHPSTISKHLTAICKKFGLGNARGEYFSYRWDLIELFAEYKPEAVNPKFRQGRSVDVEIPEGVVPLDSNFYIERPSVESRCNEITLKPGSLLRVKAPRQMGKTSLITRILAHAADQGAQTVCWDLMELDRNTAYLHGFGRMTSTSAPPH
ncbi:MAG: AAA-like domain-containing protein [Cyanobacteria bacterium P01_D01_bin.56]